AGDGTLRLLFLGRLHPKKGIENLLEGCRTLASESDLKWSLTISGAGEPRYVGALSARIKKRELQTPVKMVGENVGEGKQKLFAHADIAVIPSFTENFGLVVAEALAHGVPVIASRSTPWQRVEKVGCGLWVDNDPQSLAKAVLRMSRMPLRTMGQRGRAWM